MTQFHTLSSDSIFALASAPQGSQRALIRLSGPLSHSAVKCLLTDQACQERWLALPHGHLCNLPALVAHNVEIPCSFYKICAPRSYTGEDMAEIHTIACAPLVRVLFDALRRVGLRQAEPGEFSRRAFVNGKISLMRAQGVAAMIRARDNAELQRAKSLLRGDYARTLRAFSTELLNCLGLVEINIDFSDQDIDLVANSDLKQRLAGLLEKIERFTAQHASHSVECGLPRIVLAGLASSGKSTLFNRLLGRSRAIVDEKPGTTRDTLEAPWMLHETPVTLVDTAGFKIPSSPLDEFGLQSAAEAHLRADIIVWLCDATASANEHTHLLDRIKALSKPWLQVINKCDLLSTQLVLKQHGSHVVRISALTGQGLDVLLERLGELLRQLNEHPADYEVTAHHLAKLHESAQSVREALDALAAGASEDLIAADLHHALRCLGEITGEWTPDTVLDHIFKNFCIGK